LKELPVGGGEEFPPYLEPQGLAGKISWNKEFDL
jgi:hypothetical protein